MPNYDYECKTCGYTFEVFHSMSEEPVKECPECGKEVRKLIGGGLGVIFKGSGFYVTDSKSGAKNPAMKSSKKQKDAAHAAAEKAAV
jgi:putative FmdB family regulatory protein